MTDRTNDPENVIDRAAAEIRNQRLDEISGVEHALHRD